MGKTKIEGADHGVAGVPQVGVAECDREADRRQDVAAVLAHIDGVVKRDVSSRLYDMVDARRAGLTAAILTEPDSGFSGSDSWPLVTQQGLLYSLLSCDWGTFASLAEKDPTLKAELSLILAITDQEWDELRSVEPQTDNPIMDASEFVERLLATPYGAEMLQIDEDAA